MRIEKDILGEIEIPQNALYGIHSVRAKKNFPDNTNFHTEWYKAVGWVKLACYITYRNFKKAVHQKMDASALPIDFISDEKLGVLIEAAQEIAEGKHDKHFIVPAIQGGAGTSINLNINEIIANISLLKLQYTPGAYHILDPIEHANVYQSTNDVIPTALKVAVLFLLNDLESSINHLRTKTETLEKKHRNSLRIAYTQMQQAVPSSYGMLFSAYNEALSRDWWRVSKCFERIKTVNLGGSAVGTGITIPRYFVMEVVSNLQKITTLPVTRSENLSDNTSNLDSFVEIHAILKAHAVNLEKISNDIRLLASDLVGKNEISIPKKQVGSSIMPGKINPVVPEFTINAAQKVYANDALITNLCAQGCLDLNASIPLIGHALIESLKLLIAADKTLTNNLFNELTVHSEIARKQLFSCKAIATALIPYIGYHKASLLAQTMQNDQSDIFKANEKLQLLSQEKLQQITETQNLLKAGFSIRDIL